MGINYLDTKGGFLISGQGTGVSALGTPFDARNCAPYGFLLYASYAPSANLILQGSHDGTAWFPIYTVTATPTTGTAQTSGFFPYIRGAYSTGYSTTASAIMHFTPGLK